MMKNLIISILILFAGSILKPAQAQDVQVQAGVDTPYVMLGDTLNYIITLSHPQNGILKFLTYKDTLTKELEVLSQPPADTLSTENSYVTLRKRYHLIYFTEEDTLQIVREIPPVKMIYSYGGRMDTIATRAVEYGAFFPEVDTTKGIAPNKDIMPVDYEPLSEKSKWFWYALYALLALVLTAAAYYVIQRIRHREPIIKAFVKPKEPAHVTALHELDRLKEEKLWQKGDVKEYHDRLTDTVRRYIEGRFGLPAMEQTTGQIMDSVNRKGIFSRTTEDKLEGMLQLADMAKFAKVQPLPEHNENSLKDAYALIHETKPTEEELSKKGKEAGHD